MPVGLPAGRRAARQEAEANAQWDGLRTPAGSCIDTGGRGGGAASTKRTARQAQEGQGVAVAVGGEGGPQVVARQLAALRAQLDAGAAVQVCGGEGRR